MAGALRAKGVGNGEPVAILALTSDHYYEALLSIPWAGGVLVPVNIRWNVEEIVYSLDEAEVKTLLVDDQFLPLVEAIRNKSKSVSNFILMGEKPAPDGVSGCEELMVATAPVEDAERSGDDLMGIFYTGGTTGFPKGVMLSHNNLMLNALGVHAEGFLQGKDITLLNTVPLFHMSGLLFCNICTMTGDTQVFLPVFDPTTTLKTIQAEKITDMPLVPVMIQMAVDHPDFKDYDTRSLRRLYYGASPISEAVLQRTLSKLPNVELSQVYGMTELSPVCTILKHDQHIGENAAKGRLRSAGRSTCFVELKIVDPEDNEVPRGTVGEIVVKAPTVMQGYLKNPKQTAAALRDGWMLTGDGGYMDEEGFVYISDRLKDMIVTGAENVYPAEVENSISTFPGVATSAVIGIPSEKWGEAVHAIVVPAPGATLDPNAIIAHCKSKIAGYKCPKSIEFRDALPLTGAGKVQKNVLRDEFRKGK